MLQYLIIPDEQEGLVKNVLHHGDCLEKQNKQCGISFNGS